MNRAFPIILIPAALVAAAYWAFGLRPPLVRVAGVFVLGAIVGYLVWRKRRAVEKQGADSRR